MSFSRRPQRPKNRAAGAFSLVEVALALGIIGFCLIGIFGLFGFGLERSRQTNQDTAIASAAAQLVSKVRGAQTFDRAGGTGSIDGTHYFDSRGQEVPASASGAVYVCHLTGTYVSESELPNITDPTKPAGQTALTRLTLAFTLPASAPANRRVSGGVYYATVPTP